MMVAESVRYNIILGAVSHRKYYIYTVTILDNIKTNKKVLIGMQALKQKRQR
jgi:hypothetical protein